MNKNRIAILILIVGVAALLGYFVGNALFGQQSMKPVEVETATPIDTAKPEVSRKVFNDQAINPTVPITISDNDQNPIGN